MSFNSAEIAWLGKHGLNAYLKNKPVDQIGTDRPLAHFLMRKKKPFMGGKQYIVEQLRVKYDSNFQWYHGSDAVTFKKKDTLAQTNFTWGSCHDGFTLSEDDLFNNGITFNDEHKNASSGSETKQLSNLFKEHMETLSEGFEETLDYQLHLDGTQDGDAVAGLDHLISLTGVGTVGGINAANDTYWKNNFSTGVAGSALINTMETEWRECTRHGGKPNYILAGSDFIDEFRTQAKSEIARYTVLNTNGQTSELDPAVTGLHFNNVPIVWDPTFKTLDDDLSPAITWEKRCYMINSKSICYRPASGHDMVTRNPPREHNRYVWYWALTHKFGLTINKRRSNSVIAIS